MTKFLKHQKVFIERPENVSKQVSKNKNNTVGTILKVDKDRTCLVTTFSNINGSWEHNKWLKKHDS